MPRSLKPLRHRDFRLLAIGQLTSNLGDACYAVALPWYVLAVHGGPLLLGTVLAAYGVPRTALLAFGGAASDRWRPWTVMMASDTVRALGMVALAVAAGLGPANVAVLVPIAVVVGAGEGLFLPGSMAIVPTLLPDEDLQAGNALSYGGTELATLVGPALGGALVALIGPAPVFWVDAATFAVSAATLAGIRIRKAHAAAAEPAADQATEPAARPSVRSLLREPVLLIILLTTVAANLGASGSIEVALPALAHGPLHTGAAGFGGLVAAIGAGGVIGTLVAGQVKESRRPAIVCSIVFLCAAVALGLVPYVGTAIATGVVLAIEGMLIGFANIVMITVFQRWTPPAVLGRVTGLLLLCSYGMFPVSAVVGALVVQHFGPAPFFPIAGACLGVAILAALCQRRWRQLGTPDAEPMVTSVPQPQSAG
ncbi:MAG TPA: MFS transporter [Pseudonocardiaceae bacterium]|nr:MFS transporter [Pseudonocardiaceae bacterium]